LNGNVTSNPLGEMRGKSGRGFIVKVRKENEGIKKERRARIK
jgi:hypothetical protein